MDNELISRFDYFLLKDDSAARAAPLRRGLPLPDRSAIGLFTDHDHDL
jgi:hypothetical protein